MIKPVRNENNDNLRCLCMFCITTVSTNYALHSHCAQDFAIDLDGAERNLNSSWHCMMWCKSFYLSASDEAFSSMLIICARLCRSSLV